MIDGRFGRRGHRSANASATTPCAKTLPPASAGRVGTWLFAVVAALSLGHAAAPAAEAASCSKARVAELARSSGLLAEAERHWGFPFEVGKAACGDLTGDRRSDIVVSLDTVQGTASSPTPWAIFNRSRSGYRRKLTRLKTITYGPSILRRRVRLREPVYGPNDANCCPSRVRTVEYRWKKRRYVRRVVRTERR